MGTVRVVPLLNIHLEHQRWEYTASSHLGLKVRGVPRQCGSEGFGDSDPELWFAVLPSTHMLQHSVLLVPSSVSHGHTQC